MKATRIWPLAALFLVALPASAMADARDYPGKLGDGPRLRSSGRFDGGHRRYHQRTPVFVVPSTVVVGPSDAYVAPPPVVYSPPQVIYTPAASYAPPAYSGPPASYAAPPPPAPPAPPEPHVVEFDSGRYELRGDGVREPYLWVWVPRAPSAPPGMVTAPRTPATVYRWTDERGVVTLTDDPNKVPPQFRATDITPR
jgi:uncharacterized protein DUF4124